MFKPVAPHDHHQPSTPRTTQHAPPTRRTQQEVVCRVRWHMVVFDEAHQARAVHAAMCSSRVPRMHRSHARRHNTRMRAGTCKRTHRRTSSHTHAHTHPHTHTHAHPPTLQIKNPKSERYKAADRLPTRLRYALTGTPYQNDYRRARAHAARAVCARTKQGRGGAPHRRARACKRADGLCWAGQGL